MNRKTQNLIAAMVATVAFAAAAQAQYYAQPAPLYPYVAQQGQYVYPQTQYAPQPHPYVRTRHVWSGSHEHNAPRAFRPDRGVGKTDPAMVEELRKRRYKTKEIAIAESKKQNEIGKKRIVRDKPVMRRHVRVVDDPPIVVQREISEQGQVLSEQRVPTAQAQAATRLPAGRVIHAEAEVTILGPDSMSIRLYRKNDGRDANAKAAAKHKKSSKNQKSQPEG
jgi:hypothetical protein